MARLAIERLRQIRSSGTSNMIAVRIQHPKVIGLDQRISSAPLEIDSARRRFCSIKPPRMKPSRIGDNGKSSLRRI
ncbi:hypothetical protein D3C80_2039350 [compost metagenome]